MIFVPLSSRLVAFTGAVKRPGIFELRPNEGFGDLLTFAGGLLPTAATERLLIDRVLPPAQREPGKDRVVINAEFGGDIKRLTAFPLQDNDIVTAFAIGDLRRNSVSVLGEVFQPGQYEWKSGMTLERLVAQAQGVFPWSLRDRIKLVRAVPQTGRKEIFSLSLDDSAGRNFEIDEFDKITVLDGRLAFPQGSLLVEGAVNSPGQRKYVERMKLSDAIDLAGGVTEDAATIEIARRVARPGYTDTTAVVQRFALAAGRRLTPVAGDFPVERGDQISVRVSPGRRTFGTVTVTGNFSFPGIYAIQRDGERLRDIIQRAGGILPNAYPSSFRLVRGGRSVAVGYDRLMRNDSGDNVVVRNNDEIVITTDPAIVLVSGAVERQVAVPFHRGWGVEDYLSAAGGLAVDGDRNKVVVEGPSGQIGRSSKFLRVRRDPDVLSGSTITVARKAPATAGSVREALTTTLQIATSLASLAIAYVAVTK